ncbi:MAG TPA: serine kinase [Pseudolabrys sp.]|nr:serine kinase [Pseudolabrys sp.]
MNSAPTVHASAVLIGREAALIRGPSGAGKSRLTWQLVQAATSGLLPFARLVADDRAYLEARAGRLLVRPAAALEGLIEIRGIGIRRVPYEPVAAVGLVIDLGAPDTARLPHSKAREIDISGIRLPRLAFGASIDPFEAVLTFLATTAAHD